MIEENKFALHLLWPFLGYKHIKLCAIFFFFVKWKQKLYLTLLLISTMCFCYNVSDIDIVSEDEKSHTTQAKRSSNVWKIDYSVAPMT